MNIKIGKFRTCDSRGTIVSYKQGAMHLDNRISAQSDVANALNVTTRNGCSATLIFNGKGDPSIRLEVAELLLRSLRRRSGAI